MLVFLMTLKEQSANHEESAVAVWNDLTELIDKNVWLMTIVCIC